ncbi:hypothetical protein BASA81_015077 [Batrachochytrium salamandrivorans]|nr:hypothetical protein BASA81_015077 [Batrachochytrium salamandrivorans]
MLLTRIDTFTSGGIALCRVEFGEGVVVGFGQVGNKDVDLTVELLHRRVAPALFAGEGLQLEWNWRELMRRRQFPLRLIFSPLMELVLQFELNYKMMGVQLSKAVAGVDSAIWDALGNLYKKQVHEIWRDSWFKTSTLPPVKVYASSIAREISPNALASKFLELKTLHGITAFKMKVGERMRGVSITNQPRLQFDYQLAVGYVQEQEFRGDVWLTLLTNRMLDVYQPDFGYAGGPSTVLLIALKCQELGGMECTPHSPQGDLHPIMAWHLNKAKGGYLELACVHDGLQQVKLDPTTGGFSPTFATIGFGLRVANGEAELVSSSFGWGVPIARTGSCNPSNKPPPLQPPPTPNEAICNLTVAVSWQMPAWSTVVISVTPKCSRTKCTDTSDCQSTLTFDFWAGNPVNNAPTLSPTGLIQMVPDVCESGFEPFDGRCYAYSLGAFGAPVNVSGLNRPQALNWAAAEAMCQTFSADAYFGGATLLASTHCEKTALCMRK